MVSNTLLGTNFFLESSGHGCHLQVTSIGRFIKQFTLLDSYDALGKLDEHSRS